MKKEKFGLICILAFFGTFMIGGLLKLLGVDKSNPELHLIIFLPFGYLGALGMFMLWCMCMWDCLGNKHIKSTNLVFVSLIIFNWIAAIFYYFKFLYRKNEN